MIERFFVTVDWCNKGNRGVFASKKGNAFGKDEGPHTAREMEEILDCFHVILNPKSEPFTEDEIATYRRFVPLAEYTNEYGVVFKNVNTPGR